MNRAQEHRSRTCGLARAAPPGQETSTGDLAAGRKQLEAERETWERFTCAVASILRNA